jgi:NAD(P)-dependent dehydrogenase (short-subunit alcohol dehydrogenase family)
MKSKAILTGRTAIVTGAASGIGRGVAIALAKRGCHLSLADRNDTGLAETAALIARSDIRVTTHKLDVSDRSAIGEFPSRVLEQHPGVDLLVNNAGVALGGSFEQVSEEDFEWLFEINFWGMVRMTRAFLPLLHKSEDARVVNVSSVFGLVAPAGQVAYASSKFAIRGFSEALRHELERTNVAVSVVHPGGVATSISRNARISSAVDKEDVERRRKAGDKFLRMPLERAGEIIVRGIEARKKRILVGYDAVGLSILSRLAPVSYWKILGPRLRDW